MGNAESEGFRAVINNIVSGWQRTVPGARRCRRNISDRTVHGEGLEASVKEQGIGSHWNRRLDVNVLIGENSGEHAEQEVCQFYIRWRKALLSACVWRFCYGCVREIVHRYQFRSFCGFRKTEMTKHEYRFQMQPTTVELVGC